MASPLPAYPALWLSIPRSAVGKNNTLRKLAPKILVVSIKIRYTIAIQNCEPYENSVAEEIFRAAGKIWRNERLYRGSEKMPCM